MRDRRPHRNSRSPRPGCPTSPAAPPAPAVKVCAPEIAPSSSNGTDLEHIAAEPQARTAAARRSPPRRRAAGRCPTRAPPRRSAGRRRGRPSPTNPARPNDCINFTAPSGTRPNNGRTRAQVAGDDAGDQHADAGADARRVTPPIGNDDHRAEQRAEDDREADHDEIGDVGRPDDFAERPRPRAPPAPPGPISSNTSPRSIDGPRADRDLHAAAHDPAQEHAAHRRRDVGELGEGRARPSARVDDEHLVATPPGCRAARGHRPRRHARRAGRPAPRGAR